MTPYPLSGDDYGDGFPNGPAATLFVQSIVAVFNGAKARATADAADDRAS